MGPYSSRENSIYRSIGLLGGPVNHEFGQPLAQQQMQGLVPQGFPGIGAGIGTIGGFVEAARREREDYITRYSNTSYSLRGQIKEAAKERKIDP